MLSSLIISETVKAKEEDQVDPQAQEFSEFQLS